MFWISRRHTTLEELLREKKSRYHPYSFGLFKEDVAGNYAAVFDLSYCLTRQDTTVWEMSLEEQRMRSQQQFAMLYYLGLQAGLNSVQAYNAAGSAIRMDGATSAAPGYESVLSDYYAYNFTEYDITHGYGKFAVNDSGYFGTPGSSSRARIINGTVDEAYALFDHLSSVYTHESVGGYGVLSRVGLVDKISGGMVPMV